MHIVKDFLHNNNVIVRASRGDEARLIWGDDDIHVLFEPIGYNLVKTLYIIYIIC